MTLLDALDDRQNPSMLRQQMSFHVREAQNATLQMGQLLGQMNASAQPAQGGQFSQLQQLNARVGSLLQQVQQALEPPRY